MSKASLKDLNLTLFEQLERLNDDEEVQGDKLEREVKRTKAMVQVSTAIIKNASTILEAKRMADYMGATSEDEILQLGYGNEKVDTGTN